MKPKQPILAATDFSPLARHAAERAARLAHEIGAPLTLMHVMQARALQSLRQWLGQAHPLANRLEAEAQQQLDQLAADLNAAQHVSAHTALASGSVLDEIGRKADALNAELLVLGARGEGFLRRQVLGSTSERLLRRTQRPLLVVRQTPHAAYRRVLVALDFSPWSLQALAVARRVAPHAHLVLFNAFQVPFEEKLHFAGVDPTTIELYRQQARTQAVQQVHAFAASAGLKAGQWEPCIVEGDPSLRMAQQELALDCDLVVLGKHGQSAAEDLLLGSVTQHMLVEGSVDVLVSTAR
ncbi:universal stress protein [Hydrogenophaga sp.]|uniref:universal stress protein n=1 Tax=Hydrogenophaga sp. TaxID=1904254 RepID=UPI002715B24A|nr:universal stress protein [Hydrogenophaga sp.]MDO9604308.1 universal stress protein [Hydrogenophaga sp.]